MLFTQIADKDTDSFSIIVYHVLPKLGAGKMNSLTTMSTIVFQIFHCVSFYCLALLLNYFRVVFTDNTLRQICSLATVVKLAYYLKLLTRAVFIENVYII